MSLGLVVAQIPVSWDIAENMEAIEEAATAARAGDIVLTPEGGLSGYPHSPTDVENLDGFIDSRAVRNGLDRLSERAAERNITLWVGACLRDDGGDGEGWTNEALGLRPDGTRLRYRKANLAAIERGTFVAGNELPVFDLDGVPVGVQLCREIRFPEQWLSVAASGARIFLHPDNGRTPDDGEPPNTFGIWRSMLVARAHETGRFIASANAAHPRQHAPTLVVAPSGEIVTELPPGDTEIERIELDLDQVLDRFLSQRRLDLTNS